MCPQMSPRGATCCCTVTAPGAATTLRCPRVHWQQEGMGFVLDSQGSWAGKASVTALLEIPGLSHPGGSSWQGWGWTLPVLEAGLLLNPWNMEL